MKTESRESCGLIESRNPQPVIPIADLTAFLYVENLSQRQYQMCRNTLVKYGINSSRPQNVIDSFKKSLYPPVIMENFLVSVDAEHLFHSTLHTIITSENLDKSLESFPADAALQFSVKAGLDGSGSYHKGTNCQEIMLKTR